jgi:hypothetical protein
MASASTEESDKKNKT